MFFFKYQFCMYKVSLFKKEIFLKNNTSYTQQYTTVTLKIEISRIFACTTVTLQIEISREA